jgi:hypothetical protein
MSSVAAARTPTAAGAKVGAPTRLLRLEGAALLAGSLLAYTTTGRPWWLIPLTLLLPDLSALGYLGGTRLGARAYNLFHITPLPGVLIAVGWRQNASLATALGLVWLAHIGMDRMLGYGLKYGDDFQHTHLSSPKQANRPLTDVPPRSTRPQAGNPGS